MKPFAQRIDVVEFLAAQSILQLADDPLGCIDTDVGHDELRLEILEHVFV